MVADIQLRIAARYVRDDIPALLGEVALWVESGAGGVGVEQKQAVRATLDGLESRLKTVNNSVRAVNPWRLITTTGLNRT